jgi:hypothetical protein
MKKIATKAFILVMDPSKMAGQFQPVINHLIADFRFTYSPSLCPRIFRFCGLEGPYLKQKLLNQFDVISFDSNRNRSTQ